MGFGRDDLVIIGENFNSSRRLRSTRGQLIDEDGAVGVPYVDVDGTKRFLDITDIWPEDPGEVAVFKIPHVAQAVQKKDLDYIRWVIVSQVKAGAHMIDLNVDEISVDPEERAEWMRWLTGTAQSMTDAVLCIDSSDPETVKAGLEVHDSKKSRPAINSVSLEQGRDALIDMARERNAYVFANASGSGGMPQDAEERANNLRKVMEMMDQRNIPMEDRFLDPLVFPVGAGPDFGVHYLEAVKLLRMEYPDVRIFGGHSNVSFGMPRRKLLNHAFIVLAIAAGCDSVMIDPIMNPPHEFTEFRLAAEVHLARDRHAQRFLAYIRSAG